MNPKFALAANGLCVIIKQQYFQLISEGAQQ